MRYVNITHTHTHIWDHNQCGSHQTQTENELAVDIVAAAAHHFIISSRRVFEKRTRYILSFSFKHCWCHAPKSNAKIHWLSLSIHLRLHLYFSTSLSSSFVRSFFFILLIKWNSSAFWTYGAFDVWEKGAICLKTKEGKKEESSTSDNNSFIAQFWTFQTICELPLWKQTHTQNVIRTSYDSATSFSCFWMIGLRIIYICVFWNAIVFAAVSNFCDR